MTLSPLIGALLAPAALLCLSGCGAPRPRPTDVTFDAAPLLFITIDTLRADHLSLYGYTRPTSPFLSELAAEAVVFECALAQSSWTLPSMLSLFSSLQPPALGVHDGVRPAPRRGGSKRASEVAEVEVFAEEHFMLPEALRQAGYATDGVSTNGHLVGRQGFAQGFERFDERSCMWGDADCALGRALEILQEAPTRRHFLWVHLFDPHFDEAGVPPTYHPPAGHAELFDDGSEPDVRGRTVRDYDRKLRGLDDRLRAFFLELARVRDVGSFLVVIVADHGEEFLEKGRWGHSKAVTNTLIRVPLLFLLPTRAHGGRRVDSPVRLLDVAPTILDLLGIEPPPTFQGTSLAPALSGGLAPVPTAYGETRRGGRSLHYWVDAERDLKLVVDRNDGQRRLYRFSGDPGEERDLAAMEPQLVEELDGRLTELIEALDLEPGARPAELDEEARARLVALGYL